MLKFNTKSVYLGKLRCSLVFLQLASLYYNMWWQKLLSRFDTVDQKRIVVYRETGIL